MAPALILLSLLVSTSPLFAVEALVLFGLKEAGAPPVLPEEPRVLRVHRALWAAIESKEEAVQPLSSWAVLSSYTSRVPLPAPSVRQPGELMAVNAARVFLAREERRSVRDRGLEQSRGVFDSHVDGLPVECLEIAAHATCNTGVGQRERLRNQSLDRGRAHQRGGR